MTFLKFLLLGTEIIMSVGAKICGTFRISLDTEGGVVDIVLTVLLSLLVVVVVVVVFCCFWLLNFLSVFVVCVCPVLNFC